VSDSKPEDMKTLALKTADALIQRPEVDAVFVLVISNDQVGAVVRTPRLPFDVTLGFAVQTLGEIRAVTLADVIELIEPNQKEEEKGN
jgi:hypothetical protein